MEHENFDAFAALGEAWDGDEIFPGLLFERQVKDAYRILEASLEVVNSKQDKTGTHQKIVDAALNLINAWVQVGQDPKKQGSSEQENNSIKERHLIFSSFVAGYMASNLSDATSVSPDDKARLTKALNAHMRAIQGASKGGKSSGNSRRENSRLPSAAELALRKDKLVSAGHPERNVAATLAALYKCTPEAIRKKLKSIKRN